MARGPGYLPTEQAHTSRRVGRYNRRKEAPTITKLNRSLTDQIFGIGCYRYSMDGQLYFVHGNCRIKIKEHFPADGKPLDTLLEDLIKYSAKQKDDEIRPAC